MFSKKSTSRISFGLFLILILFVGAMPAQAESLDRPLYASNDFVWELGMSGTEYNYGRDINLDLSGNFYETGYFQNVADFESRIDQLKVSLDNTIKKVQPILFVPNNLVADPIYIPSINESLEITKAWYASQLGGKTFNFAPAQVVIGLHELKYYCPKTISDVQCIQIPGEVGADPGDINNVLDDMASQGYSIQQDTIILVFWVGGYGYAGGAQFPSLTGFAAVGDWALDGIAGKYEDGTATSHCSDSSFAWLICNKNSQIGTVAHELGHAFGLPHPTDDGTQQGDPDYWLSTLMAVSWDFPNVVLIDSPINPEKTRLLQNPFFWVFVTTFADVPIDHPLYKYIEALYDAGFTAGCSTSPLMFCPDTILDRAQSAVFMLRGQLGSGYTPPAAPWNTFGDDWTGFEWAEPWAEGMYQEGLTQGCQSNPMMYCPATQLPRVEASVFGLRMKYGVNYTPPAASGTLFADFPSTDPSYWAIDWAEQAYLDGLLPACGTDSGTGKPMFCPSQLVDRGWGAYLIVKAKNLPLP